MAMLFYVKLKIVRQSKKG